MSSPTSRSRVLTEEMVVTRTKCDRMDLIRNLNMWGNDLNQISALRLMPNLEVLSLSVNRIETLEDMRFCPKLTELYLRKNDIFDLTEVRHLRGLRHLKVLWLSDNPCATLPGYRAYVLHHLPNLGKLDSEDVTDDDRRQAARVNVDQMQTCVEHLSQSRMEADFESSDAYVEHRQSQPDMQPAQLRDDRELPRADRQAASRRLSAPAQMQDQHPAHGGSHSQQIQNLCHADRPPPADMLHDNRRGAPRAAWHSNDSPETPAMARYVSSGDSSSGEKGGLHHSRVSASGDRGVPQNGPYSSPQDEPEDDDVAAGAGNGARADNILCAVLALIKELDEQGLELVRRAIEQRQSDA